MVDKLIIEKFKKQLGSQYEIYDGDYFERNFTQNIQTPMNVETRIQYDTFEKHKDKIIGVVQVATAQYAVTSFEAINTTYTLTLWVPVNFKVVNALGEQLSESKFNVDKDLKDLREALNNKTIDFGLGYKGEMTFSEPTPAGGGYDYSGSYKRKLIVVTGKINLTTKGYYGRDYKLEIGRYNGDVLTYSTINDITSLSFSPQPSPIENHEQGFVIPEETVEAVKQACVFSLDDDCADEELNDLFTTLALSGESSKEIFMLRVSKLKKGEYKEYGNYPVYLTATLVYQFGNSDIGVFTVSCTRSET